MSGQVVRISGKDESVTVSDHQYDRRPIDLVHLSRQTLGDRDLEIELLGLFERQAGQIVAQIANWTGGGRSMRHDLAHTLKGSARAVGAVGVAAAAEAYENSLVCCTPGEVAAAQAALALQVEIARKAVAALLADR
jgi:HPt (histidine-containing phosphotransfer) domain-containing protein